MIKTLMTTSKVNGGKRVEFQDIPNWMNIYFITRKSDDVKNNPSKNERVKGEGDFSIRAEALINGVFCPDHILKFLS